LGGPAEKQDSGAKKRHPLESLMVAGDGSVDLLKTGGQVKLYC
jgi:hypothetical protein